MNEDDDRTVIQTDEDKEILKKKILEERANEDSRAEKVPERDRRE
jgi:hypothetical protein